MEGQIVHGPTYAWGTWYLHQTPFEETHLNVMCSSKMEDTGGSRTFLAI
jgi:hypothetical protein